MLGTRRVASPNRTRLVGQPLSQPKVWTMKKYLLIGVFAAFMLWAISGIFLIGGYPYIVSPVVETISVFVIYPYPSRRGRNFSMQLCEG